MSLRAALTLAMVTAACAGARPKGSSPNHAAPETATANGSSPPLLVAEIKVPPLPSPARATYPLRYEPLPASDLAAREASFRARNPANWSVVEFDASGMLVRAVLPVPARPLAPEEWRAFLERNRDLVGLDAPGLVPVAKPYNEVGWRQWWNKGLVGEARVRWYSIPLKGWTLEVSGHAWPVGEVPSSKSDDELASRFVGWPGYLETTYRVLQVPCDPGPSGPCKLPPGPAVPKTEKKPYTVARAEILVGREPCRYHTKDGAIELRVVAGLYFDVRVPPPHPEDERIRAETRFISDKAAPTRLDAVTGEDLSAGRCAQ